MAMNDSTPIQLELPFEDTITIQLTRGQETIIDAIDADLALFNWRAQFIKTYGNGGAFIVMRNTPTVNGKQGHELIHRVILSRMLGRSLVRSELVDHKDRNPLNNRRENLRLATRSQNNSNVKRSSLNTSGYKGVSYRKDSGKWRAYITKDLQRIYLGDYSTPEDAYEARCRVAREIQGEFFNPG